MGVSSFASLSLIEAFEELSLHFAVVTETWIKNGRRLENNKQRLVDSEDIGIIERNRPGRRGNCPPTHMNLKLA